ncbi:signal transduction histidine kinase [Deinococcus metalli]|uniref:histidine kinase n=1 Tax=Deinococcus metalli TaxID=1141878 RepID=A0A7W8KLN6_9DEIO|nr:ATP-binding protein [Deinococcus metalli]MBB5378884.1 signal transduction histidine kinase [Deinococcus metalli]
MPATAVQSAFDTVRDTMAVVDAAGTVRLVNRAWLTFMTDNGGTEVACGVGSSYLQACDNADGPCADEGPAVAQGLRDVLEGRTETFDAEYPCHSPTHERWFRVRITAFMDGAARYATVLHEDISERRHAEIREADLDSEVDQVVRVRTQALRTERDELDAFVGAVSHDLRTPVRHVRSFMQLLRARASERLNGDDRRLMDVIDGASGRLDGMITELLGLARVSQATLRFEDVELTQVVRRAWANLNPETQGRRIEWLARDLPVVRGDAELLRLAFENLLGNAIKYTSGRERASIEVGARATPDEWIVFVQDDGVGFNPQYVHRLFGAFQRLHSGREFEGVGMGLANVKRIVERHGGRVWAESHPGDGATFYVAFPKP